MKKILIARPLPKEVTSTFTGCEVTVREETAPLSAAEMRAALRDYDGVMPTLGDVFSAEVFADVLVPRCKILANFGVGYNHIDAACMWFVKNPEFYDTIVVPNMFGDIITDLGAMIQGGMGIAAGGNINPEGLSMFEPIGGSAPKYTGQNVINPMAAIGACQLMLETLGELEGARMMEAAIVATLKKLKGMGAGQMGYSTSEVGDLVAESVASS